jgi:Flp pilus assembly pilin Flp
MKAMKNLIVGLVRRDREAEMLEYALITGLIVVTAVAMISSVGQKFMLRWHEATGGAF